MLNHLESHEFMVRLGRPGVDLDALLHADHQELDALVLDDSEVDTALHLTHVGPAASFVILKETIFKLHCITHHRKIAVHVSAFLTEVAHFFEVFQAIL